MTWEQRRLIAAGCVLVAMIMHVYLGDWEITDPSSFPGIEYKPGSPLAVLSQPYQHTGRAELTLLCLGIVLPIVLVVAGGVVALGGQRISEAAAQPRREESPRGVHSQGALDSADGENRDASA